MEIAELAERFEVGLTAIRAEISAVRVVAEEARDQARTTNGRVTRLEKWQSYMDGVKAGAGGLWHVALAALGGAGTVAAIVLAVGR